MHRQVREGTIKSTPSAGIRPSLYVEPQDEIVNSQPVTLPSPPAFEEQVMLAGTSVQTPTVNHESEKEQKSDGHQDQFISKQFEQFGNTLTKLFGEVGLIKSAVESQARMQCDLSQRLDSIMHAIRPVEDIRAQAMITNRSLEKLGEIATSMPDRKLLEDSHRALNNYLKKAGVALSVEMQPILDALTAIQKTSSKAASSVEMQLILDALTAIQKTSSKAASSDSPEILREIRDTLNNLALLPGLTTPRPVSAPSGRKRSGSDAAKHVDTDEEGRSANEGSQPVAEPASQGGRRRKASTKPSTRSGDHEIHRFQSDVKFVQEQVDDAAYRLGTSDFVIQDECMGKGKGVFPIHRVEDQTSDFVRLGYTCEFSPYYRNYFEKGGLVGSTDKMAQPAIDIGTTVFWHSGTKMKASTYNRPGEADLAGKRYGLDGICICRRSDGQLTWCIDVVDDDNPDASELKVITNPHMKTIWKGLHVVDDDKDRMLLQGKPVDPDKLFARFMRFYLFTKGNNKFCRDNNIECIAVPIVPIRLLEIMCKETMRTAKKSSESAAKKEKQIGDKTDAIVSEEIERINKRKTERLSESAKSEKSRTKNRKSIGKSSVQFDEVSSDDDDDDEEYEKQTPAPRKQLGYECNDDDDDDDDDSVSIENGSVSDDDDSDEDVETSDNDNDDDRQSANHKGKRPKSSDKKSRKSSSSSPKKSASSAISSAMKTLTVSAPKTVTPVPAVAPKKSISLIASALEMARKQNDLDSLSDEEDKSISMPKPSPTPAGMCKDVVAHTTIIMTPTIDPEKGRAIIDPETGKEKFAKSEINVEVVPRFSEIIEWIRELAPVIKPQLKRNHLDAASRFWDIISSNEPKAIDNFFESTMEHQARDKKNFPTDLDDCAMSAFSKVYFFLEPLFKVQQRKDKGGIPSMAKPAKPYKTSAKPFIRHFGAFMRLYGTKFQNKEANPDAWARPSDKTIKRDYEKSVEKNDVPRYKLLRFMMTNKEGVTTIMSLKSPYIAARCLEVVDRIWGL